MKLYVYVGWIVLNVAGWAHFAHASQTQAVVVHTATQPINLVDKMVWQVSNTNLQLSDVQNLPNWQADYSPKLINPGQKLWGKVQLTFEQPEPSPYLLTIGNPQLNKVNVYVLDDKDRILGSYLMGSERDFTKRPIKNRLFIAPIDPQQQNITVYVTVQDDAPLVFPVSLESQTSYEQSEQRMLGIIGFIIGGLALLTCYFLITYIFLRSPIRFWFALATAAYLLYFINSSGLLGQITGITAYIANLNCVLIGFLLLASAKVAFAILEQVPSIWRYLLYTLGFSTLATGFFPNSQVQLVVAAISSAASVILLLLLATFYHKKDKKLANLIFFISLSGIACSGLVQVSLYFSGTAIDQYSALWFTFFITLGILAIGMAIEAHEKVLTFRQHLSQQGAINDLQHFYELFRNSTEGLYTSDFDGNLISVNPAMCQLFGYADEADMLSKVKNTEQFYANAHDREVMLGELHKEGKVQGKEIRGIRQDHSEFWFSISTQVNQQNGQKYLCGSISDITQRKQSNISLEYLATHDSLTGVYNRREFERRLQKALDNTQQHADLSVLFLDLDQFKIVNDTCGHKAGDLLIKQLAQQLDAAVAEQGLMARLGGDEFGVLLEGDNAQKAYMLANTLLNTVQTFRFVYEKRIFSLGVSIGHVTWQQNINTPEQLLSMADSACYLAKEKGRNQIHTYSPDDQHMLKFKSEMAWVSHLNQALQHNKFELYYLHYQSLSHNQPGLHYEILLRMQDQSGKLVSPLEFFPTAERYNLNALIDRWVIDNYFAWLANNPEHQQNLVRASINISGHSLADKDLKLFMLNAFEKHKIDYQKICFEITESMAIIRMDETLEFMQTFHKLGCSFALDDFGSGFSSYNYLKSLPIDQVKIDGNFVKDLMVDPVKKAMVKSINDIAKAMGIETVAEFVESSEIMIELGKMGVDHVQGFAVAKPQPLLDFSELR